MSIEPHGDVRRDATVDLPLERAFWTFADFDRIKPREHNLLDVDIAESVLEPHAGGAVYDRGVDGSVCRWGRVLTFDPPHAIVFTWDIGPDWQVTTDLSRTSVVEISFAAEADERTRVTLVHRHIDRHGTGWESLGESLEAPNGWPLYLSRFVAVTRTTRV